MDERAVGLGLGIETLAPAAFFQGTIGLAVRRAVLEIDRLVFARRLAAFELHIGNLGDRGAGRNAREAAVAQHRGFQRELRRQSGAHLLLAAYGAGLIIENATAAAGPRSMRSAMPRRRNVVRSSAIVDLTADLGEQRNDGGAPLGVPAREPMRNA